MYCNFKNQYNNFKINAGSPYGKAITDYADYKKAITETGRIREKAKKLLEQKRVLEFTQQLQNYSEYTRKINAYERECIKRGFDYESCYPWSRLKKGV